MAVGILVIPSHTEVVTLEERWPTSRWSLSKQLSFVYNFICELLVPTWHDLASSHSHWHPAMQTIRFALQRLTKLPPNPHFLAPSSSNLKQMPGQTRHIAGFATSRKQAREKHPGESLTLTLLAALSSNPTFAGRIQQQGYRSFMSSSPVWYSRAAAVMWAMASREQLASWCSAPSCLWSL